MKHFITKIFLLFLLLNTNKSYSQVLVYNPSIDVISYDFEITISDTKDHIVAISTNKFILIQNNGIIKFDLASIDSLEKGMQISKITQNGNMLNYQHDNDKISINTLSEWEINDTLSIKIHYKGVPKDGLIISKNKYGDRTFFGDNWPNRAHNYLPVIDHPSDKSIVSFTIKAPHHYQVISNGMLIERSYLDSIHTLTSWKSKTRIPTKVMVFAAANFSTAYLGKVGCVPVTAWVFNQNKNEGFSDYHTSIDVLNYFTNYLGDYPYHKLANVQSKTRYGGMENASCIFYYENSVTGDGKVDGLIAHEIAHQWFGNSVSEQEWEHIWISEGFATYMADLYMKHKYGDTVYHYRLQEEKAKAIAFIDRAPMPIIARDIKKLTQLLNPNSYQRAAWVLHMYHDKVGDQLFWETLNNYYHQFKDGNATTYDFIAIASETTGSDWKPFFMQWLDRSDYPILKITTIIENENFIVNIKQLQEGDAYHLDLPISTNYKGEISKININCSTKNTDFTLESYKDGMTIDLSSLNNLFCKWEE